jgi:protein-S-isoprenylcysteine O-methyltransferase Ste14
MTDVRGSATDPKRFSRMRLGLGVLLRVVAMFSVFAATMFIAAGRLDWWEAWAFWVIYFLISVASTWELTFRDLALVRERSQAFADASSKRWDRIIVVATALLSLGLFAMIGLDAGRFRWSGVPGVVRALGGVAVLFSFGLSTWASRANTYLSALVRIQDERGHQAVTHGPYLFVRHPMYAGMCLYDLGVPLLLGSWWSLVVSGIMIAVLIARTAMEDRTLRGELVGYSDYAKRVRWKLIPGVW